MPGQQHKHPPRPVQRLLAAFSGTDVSSAYEHDSAIPFARLGALMMFMFGWYAVAMGHAIGIAMHRTEWRYVTAFGFAWALFLTLFDRVIIAQTLARDGFWYRFTHLFLGRGLLAVAGSLVTSIGALLFLFQSDVSSQVVADQQRLASTIVGPVATLPQVQEAQKQIAGDNRQLATLASSVLAATNLVKVDEVQVACEANGRCGTHVPDDPNHVGPQTAADMAKQHADQVALNAAVAAQGSAAPAVRADIVQQNAVINAAYTDAGNAVRHHDGLQSQTTALGELLARDWTMWVWVLVVVFADIAVIALRAFMPATKLDLAMRRRMSDARELAAAWNTSPQRARVLAAELDRIAVAEDARYQAEHDRDLDGMEGRAVPSASGSGQRSWKSGRAIAGLASIGVVLAVAVGASGHAGHTAAPGKLPTSIASPAHSNAASPAVPNARLAAYRLPTVTAATAIATRNYLKSAGSILLQVHHATAAMLAGYTATACRGVAAAVGSPSRDLAAAGSAPDAVLAELSLDELHDLSSLPACPPGPPPSMGHLAAIDKLITIRLGQNGVST